MTHINQQADIHIQVHRDASQDVETIRWQASDAPSAEVQESKAMVLALWEAEQRTSLRIDLWTKDMTVQDMNDFFFQTLMTMADTYKNATGNQVLMAEMKNFAQEFARKAYSKEKQQHLANG